jgi:tetratricopeptide (TPR) repeat protein
MPANLSANEEAQLLQTIEMFEVITQSQPQDYQSLEILKEAYFKLGRQKHVVDTSKRIAQAYVGLGQLSSAILEYESILQRYPDDPDVRNALAEIESKANSLAARPIISEADLMDKPKGKAGDGKTTSRTEIDDGRDVMKKIFVEGKLIPAEMFTQNWHRPKLSEPPAQVNEPFIQLLDEKSVYPLDKSLKLLCDKSRLGYLPLEKYDIDVELARSFPKDTCQRWCVLPFDKMSKSILVATANPFNRQAALELERATNHRLLWYITHPAETVKILKKILR